MSKAIEKLETILEEMRPYLSAEDEAREKALRLCRQVIRFSASAIRSVHRQEMDNARKTLVEVRSLVEEMNSTLSNYPSLLNSGFVHDAQKEFAEGSITLAIIAGEDLPRPEALQVRYAAYLNGMGEAMGELRRYILDSIRRGNFSRCEEMLETMDAIYSILMTMDFPQLLAHGLRRTTDALRGIVERTRGDLTVALKQKELEAKLSDLS
jgi:translin